MNVLRSRVVLHLLLYLRKRKRLRSFLPVLPSAIWVLLFLFVPLMIILFYSFSMRGEGGTIIASFGLQNYRHFWTTPIYTRTVFKSLAIGFEVTLVCLVLGYLPAYYLARLKTARRIFLIILLIIPFWTSIIIRTYSWILILGRRGPINYYLMKWRLIEQPIQLLYNEFSVILGLVHIMLPFMILPIFASIDRMDQSLLDASKSLGAGERRTFLEITFPLSLPGVSAGCLLVFIISVGAFLTPAMLGGPGDMMIAMLIQQNFLMLFDWPFGSAAAIIYLIMIVFIVFVFNKAIGLDKIWMGTQR
ncbi:MAG: ABC transporter permease [Deltaproteobacteria bacterium]|nr:ABC transporter permease [Deltaproteobacteria bacterium]